MTTPSGSVALALLLAAGCGGEAEPEPAAPAPPATEAADDVAPGVFGHLETRFGRVTIRSTTEGPRFTVTREAEVLARDVDQAWLEEHMPELAALLRQPILPEPQTDDVGNQG